MAMQQGADPEHGQEQADLHRMRHSAAHVMAQAVTQTFPEAKLGIGPAIQDGFYYDFDLPRTLTPEDLGQLERGMQQIITSDLPFERREMDRDEALAYFRARGQPYKVELIEELTGGERAGAEKIEQSPDAQAIRGNRVTVYEQGDFVDLCAGPHVHSTGQIGPVKLLRISGAYWRGDERRPQLQRIYGTAWDSQEALDQYLWRLEEARKRDHRRLGQELDLFVISDEVGSGLPIWLPRGATLRTVIEDFWKQEHQKAGYQYLYTPHIGSTALWAKSGHLSFFRENMYSPIEVDDQQFMLKPMNCPFHLQAYKRRIRSYRELPLRYAELGTVYRYERAGVLHGLLRVRGITQDDSHIFCRPDQLEAEIIGVLELGLHLLRTLGFREYDVELAVRDPRNPSKYMGSDERWQQAESVLASALDAHGLKYRRVEGEATFYAPKIDLRLLDALGRSWQCTTIQVDFNLPERFDLGYIGEDGQEHRPFMVHRALLGSLERFIGTLIEHYGGAFPVWLAPVQAIVLPIADRHVPYGQQVLEMLTEARLRAELDDRNERMQSKIRDAQLQKVPYMLIVGDREQRDRTVAVRLRSGEDLGPEPVGEVLNSLIKANERRE